MKTLLLRLTGPLQAWGVRSRYVRRETAREPTKSGVIGMLAAARGHRRTDPLPDDLLGLKFGVRVERAGSIVRDFQTARRLDDSSLPLSNRLYLADAAFLAAVEGEAELMQGLYEHLKRPRYPLYLGRRSCPPAGPVVVEEPLDMTYVDVLQEYVPKRVAPKLPRRISTQIARDAIGDEAFKPDEPPPDIQRDVPVSFDPEHREHDWRPVIRYSWEIHNPLGIADPPSPDPDLPAHEPAVFGG